MLPVRVRPAALDELAEAWSWYEDQRSGLGDEFRACVDVAMAELSRTRSHRHAFVAMPGVAS